MLIAGTWGALLLYIISWISGLFSSNLVQPSGSRFQVWTDVTGMRTAWLIHTVTLLGLSKSGQHFNCPFFCNPAAWFISHYFPKTNAGRFVAFRANLVLSCFAWITYYHSPGRRYNVGSCMCGQHHFSLSGAPSQN